MVVGDNEAQHWAERGLCRTNPDLFFAGPGEREKTALAISMCFSCPVCTQCREHALRRREGSASGEERRRPNVNGYGRQAPQPRKS